MAIIHKAQPQHKSPLQNFFFRAPQDSVPQIKARVVWMIGLPVMRVELLTLPTQQDNLILPQHKKNGKETQFDCIFHCSFLLNHTKLHSMHKKSKFVTELEFGRMVG